MSRQAKVERVESSLKEFAFESRFTVALLSNMIK
jgi:hypothetical protein